MLDLLQTLLAFVVALGVLVAVHEYGHYEVARRLGIRILRFSVGFGPVVWSRKVGPDGTEFALSAIPLGGYVKMLDEREGPVAQAERHRAFNTQSVARRMAVVVAGPLANFLLAVVLYWCMFIVGVSGPKPVIGEVTAGGVAAIAGLKPGDEIIQVDGRPTALWDSIMSTAIDAILDARVVELTVRQLDGAEKRCALDFSRLSVDDLTRGEFFAKIGFKPRRPTIAPVIGKLVPGEPADRAGLLAGDVLKRVDGEAVDDWMAWVARVRAHPGKAMHLVVLRGGAEVELAITPQSSSVDGKLVGRIGAEVAASSLQPDDTPQVTERFGPLDAASHALERTWSVSATSLKFMHRMLVGEASTENLSGPISIAQIAGASAKLGASRFLEFMGLVSVSLGVLNLLPIPLLDGGHLMYYCIEAIMRRPLPERLQVYGQQLGLMVLMCLMGLAVFNDIMRNF